MGARRGGRRRPGDGLVGVARAGAAAGPPHRLLLVADRAVAGRAVVASVASGVLVGPGGLRSRAARGATEHRRSRPRIGGDWRSPLSSPAGRPTWFRRSVAVRRVHAHTGPPVRMTGLERVRNLLRRAGRGPG